MPSASRTPWTFDRSWGDPMIAMLLLLSLLLSSQILGRRLAPPPPSQRVSLAGRLAEASLLAPQVLNLAGRSFVKPTLWEKVGTRFEEPWDRAMAAVLAREQGELAAASSLAAGSPALIRKAIACAYEGGERLSMAERAQVLAGLSPTYAGRLLESRLLDQEGQTGAPLRAQALAFLSQRVRTLALLGSALFVLGVAGLAFAVGLLLRRSRPLPEGAHWSLGGRPLALVVLAWFSVLLLSGTLAGLLVLPLPSAARILALPLGYGIHAAFAVFLLCGFSGTNLHAWRARFFPLSWGRSLAWALGFAGLAVLTVFLVGLALAPLLRHSQPAQKELLETLAAARSLPATVLIFLTVAVLAPAFEELFFRGFLFPWMAARWGRIWGLLASSLLFGAIHLVPGGLPTLTSLGLVLGLAYLLTGDLRVCILVHGLWNGAVFLFTRWVLG